MRDHASAAHAPPVDGRADRPASSTPPRRGSALVLLSTVFVVAICGLVYELLAGALSSYLLGSTVTQFSVVIGIFLTAMGLGSLLSRSFTKELLRTFMVVELLIGLIGGCSALALFFAFAVLDTYTPLLVLLSLAVGALAGLEIPLLIRILRGHASLKATLGNVLAIDYLGALVASILFPLVLVPRLGLVRTGFLFGLLNVLVAIVGLHYFRKEIRGARTLLAVGLVLGGLLGVGLVTAGRTTSMLEDVLYDDEVIFAKSTPFQRLVITRWRDDVRLFIDGNIQFSTVDEFRYHESLVHPVMGLTAHPKTVLLLGAGDGMAAREVLKHPSVTRIDLVDLDPEVTRIFSTVPLLVSLNDGALKDKRVTIHNKDAQKYLERCGRRYDVIIIDLPDPNDESLGKLYTRSFYRLVAQHLAPGGALVTQATSPFYTTDSFWCVVNTLASTSLSRAGGRLHVLPYHVNVPSFGEWGFVMAALRPIAPQQVTLQVSTRFLSPALLSTLFVFPKDVSARETPINYLNDQVLVRLYEGGYRRFSK